MSGVCCRRCVGRTRERQLTRRNVRRGVGVGVGVGRSGSPVNGNTAGGFPSVCRSRVADRRCLCVAVMCCVCQCVPSSLLLPPMRCCSGLSGSARPSTVARCVRCVVSLSSTASTSTVEQHSLSQHSGHLCHHFCIHHLLPLGCC